MKGLDKCLHVSVALGLYSTFRTSKTKHQCHIPKNLIEQSNFANDQKQRNRERNREKDKRGTRAGTRGESYSILL